LTTVEIASVDKSCEVGVLCKVTSCLKIRVSLVQFRPWAPDSRRRSRPMSQRASRLQRLGCPLLARLAHQRHSCSVGGDRGSTDSVVEVPKVRRRSFGVTRGRQRAGAGEIAGHVGHGLTTGPVPRWSAARIAGTNCVGVGRGDRRAAVSSAGASGSGGQRGVQRPPADCSPHRLGLHCSVARICGYTPATPRPALPAPARSI
jgi:hypothetical protein